jgi:bacillithiol biosynthesis cysteine-adding enzyme BshC
MEPGCVRMTELPNTSALFADYLYRFERVARFYGHDPQDAESFRRAAAAVDFSAERRAALVAALGQQNAAGAALEKLAQPGTVAVMTGQQVGLFLGPCYAVYKALTAVRLAARLTESGIPAVPVFWLATEDHDFDEVNHCWVFNAANEPVRLELAGGNAERRPVGGILIDKAPVAGLRDALRGLPFGEETAALVAEAYADGETLGSAFGKLLRRILRGQDLLLFDPMHAASRRLAAPLLADAVRAMPELTARLVERGRELAAAGYHSQVLIEGQTSLVFLLENGRRLGLRRNGDEFQTPDGRRISSGELAARAESLSPNAVLRPVVQDSMLPTVAYVGGPAELAYLAQSQVIYEALLERMPVAAPRASATLLDGRAAKLFDRYGLTLPDFFRGEDAIREQIAAKLVPPGLAAAIGEARVKVGSVLDGLDGELARFDPTLGAAFATSRRKIEYQVAKTERKAARESLRRDERASADAAYASGLVFPGRHLQERRYSVIPFVARHGEGLMEKLAGEMGRECVGHRVVVV